MHSLNQGAGLSPKLVQTVGHFLLKTNFYLGFAAHFSGPESVPAVQDLSISPDQNWRCLG
jgi:hypothetical protein